MTNRSYQLDTIWRTTHRDYTAKVEGARYVLALRDGATCLISLESLTDAEIRDRLERRGFAVNVGTSS
jgi:hypothetical protein